MLQQINLADSFTLPGTPLTVNRMGYGAMQLAGPQVFGPPRDIDVAIAVLREAVESGVNHIDTSDYYGPHVTNQIIKRALHLSMSLISALADSWNRLKDRLRNR
jgi:pyridoxine 4-dehydrogenase